MGAVAALLVDIEAWEQRVPDRDPRPDESRAYLRIEADGVRVEVWEWYNDLDKNRRLSRVRDHLQALFPSQESPDSGKPSQ